MKKQKFRAWDKMKNEMFYPKEKHDERIVMQLNGTVGLFNGKAYETETDRFVIEQFTGLKDKKGVKIYEGDVVSFDIETDDEFGGVFIGVVSYISELAGYIIQSESNGYTLNSDVEIIGNIHENPELLTSNTGGL